jgi:mannosyltransferase
MPVSKRVANVPDVKLPSPDQLPFGEVTAACVSLLLVFVFAARAITSSLWLDETATYWVIKDGLQNVFRRCWEWTGASAPYDLLAWVSSLLAPAIGIEPALRLPSLVAMAIAAALVYQLGRYMADQRTGLLSAVAFLCIHPVAFAAIDARPYALGLALLVASMLFLLKWLDSSRRLYAVIYVIASALVVYTHYLLALGLVAQLVYGRRHIRKLAPLWLAIGALCLPLGGHLLNLFETRQAHVFSSTPSLSLFLAAVAPASLAAAVLLTIMFSRRPAVASIPIPRQLLLVWFFFPPVFLFLVSILSDTKLFYPRYYLSSAPAVAILAGYAVSRMGNVSMASLLFVAVYTITFWQSSSEHVSENWRGAMAALNAQATAEDTVLVASAFVEGTPQDINRRDVLFAPQLVYPIGPMFRLPSNFDEKAIPADLLQKRRVFLVAVQRQMEYASWLVHHLPGYRAESLGSFGAVVVLKFEK